MVDVLVVLGKWGKAGVASRIVFGGFWGVRGRSWSIVVIVKGLW